MSRTTSPGGMVTRDPSPNRSTPLPTLAPGGTSCPFHSTGSTSSICAEADENRVMARVAPTWRGQAHT